MIDEIWNTRQVNDYTGKNINKKDFMRSWTHSRTAQHISFDELLEEGTTFDIYCGEIQGRDNILDFLSSNFDPITHLARKAG